MIKQLLLVALGGAIGSVARFTAGRIFAVSTGNVVFPWSTFSVNITGCFIIGILWALSFKTGSLSENMKLFLMTGICGGFTTFSAFSLESVNLLREQKNILFLCYTLGSLTAGFLATYMAFKIFKS